MRVHALLPSHATALLAGVLPMVPTALPAQGSPTVFRVSAYGAYPNGTNAGPGIRQAIAAADATPNSIVQFDAGTYLVDPLNNSGIFLGNVTDLTLQGSAAATTTIAFRDRLTTGFSLFQCSKVALDNLVLSYEQPCHFEGTLERATQAGGSVTYLVRCATPVNPNDTFLFGSTSYSAHVHVFDPITRSRRPLSAKLRVSAATANATGARVTLTVNEPWTTAEPIANRTFLGDAVAVGREVGAHLIWSTRSADLAFKSVRFERAPMFAAQHTFDGNVLYRGCTIGATAGSLQPLLSTNRDGLRFRSMRGTPQVVDCCLERCGDDAINVHSQWLRVDRIDPSTGHAILKDAWNQTHPIDVRINDQLVLYHDTDLATQGTCSVIGVTAVNSSAMLDVKYSGTALTPGQRLINATAQAAGVIIENNLIRDVEARGVLLRAISGRVQGNHVVGAPKGGIVVSPDTQYFQESGFSRSLTIANNAVHVCGFERWHQGHTTSCNLGSITVGVDHPLSSWPSGFGHAEILIDNNWIAATPLVGLFLASANTTNVLPWTATPVFGSVAQNNWIPASQLAPSSVAGSQRGITGASGGMHLLHVDNTSALANRVDNRGSGTVYTVALAGAGTSILNNRPAWSTSFETEEGLTWNGASLQPFIGRILAGTSTSAVVGTWRLTMDTWHLQGRDPILDVARGYQCTVCPTTGGSLTIQVPTAAQATTSELAFWASLGGAGGGTPQPLLVHVIGTAGTTTMTIPATALPAAPQAQLFQVPLPAGTITIQFQRLASNAELFLDDVVVVY